MVQLIIFGYAATFDIRAADVGVVDHAHTQQARDLLGSVVSGGEFLPHFYPHAALAAMGLGIRRLH